MGDGAVRRMGGCVVATVIALACAAAAGAAELKVSQAGPKVTAENDFYKLSIDASRGGAVRSFVYKKFDPAKEWIYPEGGGLMEDMIWQQNHPGELQNHPYECKIVEQTPARCVIELWRAFQQDPFKGLVMRKRITLAADSPALPVAMTLENTIDKDLFPGAWVQNRAFCGGNKGVQVSYRPSYLGIRMAYIDKSGREFGEDFVRRPAGGWAMMFDQDSKAGLLALMDYNYLRMHYTCLSAYTNEWFYDRVLIPPGKSWTTAYTLIPVKDVDNCYHADADLFITASREGDTLSFNVRASDAPVAAATLSARIEKADRSAMLLEGSVELKNLLADVSQPLKLAIPGLEKEPGVVVTLDIESNGKKRGVEFMYCIDSSRYFAQETASTYRAPLPRKIKPELTGDRKLALTAHKGVSVLHGMGLWYDFNRVPEILKGIDPEAAVKEASFHISTLGPELTYQPLLAEELMGYDLIILNNVGANALGEPGEAAVDQFVRSGGALLIMGGICTMGKGRFDEGPLAEALPLAVIPFFDLAKFDSFERIIDPKSPDKDHGTVRWYQKPKAVKPDATTVLTAKGEPMLLVRKHGKGKVAVFLGTPMGDPPQGATPYWESEAWTAFMRGFVGGILPGKE